ncbi:hypothetical protein BOTNAR_0171g00140 [Botryotinia narcissicola]|uniref:Uncharacterized protein n=1 Tax=Botryotinia narcissicola TaxID=278944 RepID=A0A4Z1IBL3_9HELO|nr:hypothetical protein BOTNAR_0171g00140 [Botryotinia narcissicola]
MQIICRLSTGTDNFRATYLAFTQIASPLIKEVPGPPRTAASVATTKMMKTLHQQEMEHTTIEPYLSAYGLPVGFKDCFLTHNALTRVHDYFSISLIFN